MLRILKDLLPDNLHIKNVKELSNKYKIEFEFDGDCATAELRKTCVPKAEYLVAFDTIKSAMSTIYFNKQLYNMCGYWLDMTLNEYSRMRRDEK